MHAGNGRHLLPFVIDLFLLSYYVTASDSVHFHFHFYESLLSFSVIEADKFHFCFHFIEHKK